MFLNLTQLSSVHLIDQRYYWLADTINTLHDFLTACTIKIQLQVSHLIRVAALALPSLVIYLLSQFYTLITRYSIYCYSNLTHHFRTFGTPKRKLPKWVRNEASCGNRSWSLRSDVRSGLYLLQVRCCFMIGWKLVTWLLLLLDRFCASVLYVEYFKNSRM